MMSALVILVPFKDKKEGRVSPRPSPGICPHTITKVLPRLLSVCIVTKLDTGVKGFLGILKIFLGFCYGTLCVPYRTMLVWTFGGILSMDMWTLWDCVNFHWEFFLILYGGGL